MSEFKLGDKVRHIAAYAYKGVGTITRFCERDARVQFTDGAVVCQVALLEPAPTQAGTGLFSTPGTITLASPLDDVWAELKRAASHGPFASAHEGYAVILEEMDELKEHVWTKHRNRDLIEMRKEAVQVAAMAIKFIQMIDNGVAR